MPAIVVMPSPPLSGIELEIHNLLSAHTKLAATISDLGKTQRANIWPEAVRKLAAQLASGPLVEVETAFNMYKQANTKDEHLAERIVALEQLQKRMTEEIDKAKNSNREAVIHVLETNIAELQRSIEKLEHEAQHLEQTSQDTQRRKIEEISPLKDQLKSLQNDLAQLQSRPSADTLRTARAGKSPKGAKGRGSST